MPTVRQNPTPPGAWDSGGGGTGRGEEQPEYTPTKQELLNQINAKKRLIQRLKTRIAQIQKWIAACKPLGQFADGNLLARITPFDYNNLSEDAKNEKYVWISEKDRQTFNESELPGDISPDFSVHVRKPEDLLQSPNKFRGRGWGGTTNFNTNVLSLYSKKYLTSLLISNVTKNTSEEGELAELLALYKKLFGEFAPSGPKKGGPKNTAPDTPSTTEITYVDLRTKPTKYNVPSVKDAYYSSKMFQAVNSNDSGSLTSEQKLPLFEGNIPSRVNDAKDLWETALGSKGMFQVSTIYPESQTYTVSNPDPNKNTLSKATYEEKWGFQFLYNPSTIEMQYMGIAQTDMTMYTSGTEAFNLMPPTTTSATVSFDILINRMNDMKYYDKNGKLTQAGKTAYPDGLVPDAKEQKQIYNMGTMYDIEYLLKTLLGYTMKSYLRNNMETADMGWFSKRPVELHLGKNLRYLGFVGGVSLRHAIFDERMVPLFTTVHIEFSRIPDYADLSMINSGTANGRNSVT